MRTLQLDPWNLNTRLLLMFQRLLPPCSLDTPSLPWPDTHLLEVDASVFRRKVEERLCELGGNRGLGVAESRLEDCGWDGFAGHGIHAAGGVLEEGLMEDWEVVVSEFEHWTVCECLFSKMLLEMNPVKQ